jgi:hypothetical protein
LIVASTKPKLLLVTLFISLPLLTQKKCKDCRRGGGVNRWRRKGEREMEAEGEERGEGA